MTPHVNHIPREIILYGGTGQAKIVAPIIAHHGARVVAVFDDTPGLASPFPHVPIYEGWQELLRWVKSRDPAKTGFCVTIGNPHGRVRLRVHDQISGLGLQPVTLIHPTAWVADDAEVGAGSQIMAGAVIQPRVRVGTACIINALSYLDHDSHLGDGSEVSAGARVMGHAQVGSNTLVGVNAIVLSKLRVGDDVRVAAGSIVADNLESGTTVAGTTGREQ